MLEKLENYPFSEVSRKGWKIIGVFPDLAEKAGNFIFGPNN